MARVIEKRSTTKPPPLVSKSELAEQAGVTKRRTRKPKEQPEPEALPEIDPVVVKTTISAPFDVLARVRRFDGWRLTDSEADKLTAAWVPAFNKWLVPHMGDYLLLFAAFIATTAAVMNKAADERDYREKESQKTKDLDVKVDASKSDHSHIRS